MMRRSPATWAWVGDVLTRSDETEVFRWLTKLLPDDQRRRMAAIWVDGAIAVRNEEGVPVSVIRG